MHIEQQSLNQLSTALANHHLSSVELTTFFLARIAKYDPILNSFISVCEHTALAQAKAADERRAQGKATPLTGIPIACKDIFCTKGMKTSCGSKMLDNFISPYNATVVSRLADAGMVLLGKTNMDEFAMGSSTENSFYGACCNPWDISKVPGGSSGGSAAAVAAGLTPAALGSDTGGSIRQPAAFCGITGLKPTYGRVSRYGMVAFASSLDQGGPMARSAEDCALLLNAIAGFDAKDSTCVENPVPDYTATLNNPLKGLKIGLPEDYFNASLNAEMAAALDKAINVFTNLGAQCKKIRLPHTELSIPAYYIIAPAECSSNLARYDGVRYGYRCENPKNMDDLYTRSRRTGFGSEVKRRIMVGTYVLSAGYYDAFYLKAQKVRRLIAADFTHAFSSVDLILGPATPTPAFALGEKTGDPLAMYAADIYTIAVNLAGLPAASIPAGFINGLPIGLQLTGNHFAEAQILNAAHQFQQQTRWQQQMPPSFSSSVNQLAS